MPHAYARSHRSNCRWSLRTSTFAVDAISLAFFRTCHCACNSRYDSKNIQWYHWLAVGASRYTFLLRACAFYSGVRVCLCASINVEIFRALFWERHYCHHSKNTQRCWLAVAARKSEKTYIFSLHRCLCVRVCLCVCVFVCVCLCVSVVLYVCVRFYLISM